jgi:hypothetical protein
MFGKVLSLSTEPEVKLLDSMLSHLRIREVLHGIHLQMAWDAEDFKVGWDSRTAMALR